MNYALKAAEASCRLVVRASFAFTKLTLLKIEEAFRADSNENRSNYYDAIHEDDDDMSV